MIISLLLAISLISSRQRAPRPRPELDTGTSLSTPNDIYNLLRYGCFSCSIPSHKSTIRRLKARGFLIPYRGQLKFTVD